MVGAAFWLYRTSVMSPHCLRGYKSVYILTVPRRFRTDDVVMAYANERNIVILGKVGSGKRTLGNHILGKEIFRRKHGVLGTRNVGAYYEEGARGYTVYRILTVDTESLQTGYNDPIPHIRKKFKFVHSIIFVIPHGRYTDESHASLLYAVESLNPRARSVSALVITHCEGMTDAQRRGISDEFRDNPRSSQVVSFMTKGMYAVGFPDTSALPPHLKPIMQDGITGDEKTIRELVNACESSLTVENLQGQFIRQPFQRPLATAMQMPTADPRTQSRASGGFKQHLSNYCNIL